MMRLVDHYGRAHCLAHFALLSSYLKATITRLFDGFFEKNLNFYFSWIFAILSYLGLKFTRARIKKVTSMNQDFLKNVWHIHLVHTSYLTHCGCKSRNLSKKIFTLWSFRRFCRPQILFAWDLDSAVVRR